MLDVDSREETNKIVKSAHLISMLLYLNCIHQMDIFFRQLIRKYTSGLLPNQVSPDELSTGQSVAGRIVTWRTDGTWAKHIHVPGIGDLNKEY